MPPWRRRKLTGKKGAPLSRDALRDCRKHYGGDHVPLVGLRITRNRVSCSLARLKSGEISTALR